MIQCIPLFFNRQDVSEMKRPPARGGYRESMEKYSAVHIAVSGLDLNVSQRYFTRALRPCPERTPLEDVVHAFEGAIVFLNLPCV